MSDNGLSNPGLSRRDFLSTAAAATGALVVGFWMPQRAAGQIMNPEGATWATEPHVKEINAWVVVAPDDTVTIRIAQTELGQGVWTSNAMMVAEELQCDWSKVSPQYASVNRDGREIAPEWSLQVMGKGATDPLGGGEPEFGQRSRIGSEGIPNSLYRRMRTNAAASVKDGRYYLQLAGAEARERLLLAAAKSWGVPVNELSSANSVITHRPTGRTTTYGQVAPLAARTPHPNPERIRIKPPSEWTLMGTEQKNLDVPLKVTGKTIYGIDVRLPGMKWVAVKTCPAYGGTPKNYDFERIRNELGVISVVEIPIPDPSLIRDRVFSGGVAVIAESWYQAKTALDKMPIEWDVPPAHAALNTANMRAALIAALDQPGRVRANLGDCDSAFLRGARIV
jgi:isoquinoline 1-oxidoreductase subunit beta